MECVSIVECVSIELVAKDGWMDGPHYLNNLEKFIKRNSMDLCLHTTMMASIQNFGYTVEQEGDSFSIAFEDPRDAVTFALQV